MNRMKKIALMGLALGSLWLIAPAGSLADDKADSQADQEKVVLNLKLPRPAFVGTPKQAPAGIRLDPTTGTKRGPFQVPKGTQLLSHEKPVTSSDREPIIGELSMITDGDKEASDGSWVELAPGRQWVQIDLGQAAHIYAVLVWHHHGDARVYRDVVVQVADDEDFISNVQTLYNSDSDNSSGLGIGKDWEYFETNEGRLVDGKGAKGRYVRLYSNGSTSDDQNHYTEVEVYGIPAN